MKVSPPAEVLLEVEADARPIKIYKTGYHQTAHTTSRNPAIAKPTPGGKRKTTSTPTPYYLKGVTREKTTPALSRNPFKFKQRSTTQSVSRNTTKEKAQTAQSMSHNALKMKPATTKPTKLHKSVTNEKKIEPKSKNMSDAKSARNISAISKVVTTVLSQPIPKQSQINEHLARPSHKNVHGGTVTSAVWPSTTHASKKPSSISSKTASVINSTEKLKPSKKFVAKSNTIAHSSQLKPRIASSTIFYSKASTSTVGDSSKNANVRKYNSQHTSDHITSCKEREVLHHVSPPVGKETALGPAPDMRTCIELACDVGGDVAVMRSAHCFVVTCQSLDLCKASDVRPGGSDITSTVAFLRKRGQSNEGR